MWEVSDEFLAALTNPHEVATVATYTVPGGSPQTLRIKSGSVSCSSGVNIRRRGRVSAYATSAQFIELGTPGTLVEISHGLKLASGIELVPVFTGEVTVGDQDMGEAGTVPLSLADLGVWIARCDFVIPWTIAPGTTRVAAIAAIITDARPGTSVLNLSSDTGTLAVAQTFRGSRWDAINVLAADGGTEAFFRADGVFVIRDQPTMSTSPAWTLNRLLTSAVRSRPNDRLYNAVVVAPSATDGSQTWAEQVVEITDTSHPRHKSKIGRVPYRLASPTIQSADSAQHAGAVRLDRILGTTETLRLGSISHPGLEGGDLLRIVVPQLASQPADIFSHYVDDHTLDLDTGHMTLSTRKQAVDS